MRRGAAGFTLLELLVAVAVLGVMGAMAFQGLSSMAAAARELDARSTGLRRLTRAVALLERDLRAAVPRGVRDALGEREPLVVGGLERLTFTRAGWDNPLGHKRSRLERVAYALEDGRLLRLSWAVLDRSPGAAAREQVLIDEVASFDVDFLPPGGDQVWVGAWPPPASAAQTGEPWPRAVRVAFEGATFGRVERVIGLPGGAR